MSQVDNKISIQAADSGQPAGPRKDEQSMSSATILSRRSLMLAGAVVGTASAVASLSPAPALSQPKPKRSKPAAPPAASGKSFAAFRDGRRLTIEGLLSEPAHSWAVEIRSDRNASVSKMSDFADADPGTKIFADPVDNWFPVVDVAIDAAMHAEFDLTGAEVPVVYFNSFLDDAAIAVGPSPAQVEGRVLLPWENVIHIPGKKAGKLDFRLLKVMRQLPTVSLKATMLFDTLTEDWGGVLRIHRIDARGVRTLEDEIAVPRPPRKIPASASAANAGIDSLNLSIGYLMRSQNKSPTSPHEGGLHLFYDLDADTYRNAHWPWSWGPAINLLLQAAAMPAGTFSYSPDALRRAAIEIGNCSLRFAVVRPGEVYDGFSTTRYTPRTANQYGTSNGFQELVNTGSDGGFLAGWGWIPIYEATGDSRFLNAATHYIDTMKPVLDKYKLPPQEWLPAVKNWTDFTIDESGFGTEGIDAVHRVTGDPKYAAICREYIDMHIRVLERDDGLWNRQYTFSTDRVDNTEFMTRGMGWAMEGLLAAYRCTQDIGYLMRARNMAKVLMETQQASGAWTFKFAGVGKGGGDADKGTALWCLLFYMLHSATGDAAHLATARKALGWLRRNQYRGDNPHAVGGIVSQSGESGITYRAYFNMCCQYTSGFFGLAEMMEMKIKT